MYQLKGSPGLCQERFLAKFRQHKTDNSVALLEDI